MFANSNSRSIWQGALDLAVSLSLKIRRRLNRRFKPARASVGAIKLPASFAMWDAFRPGYENNLVSCPFDAGLRFRPDQFFGLFTFCRTFGLVPERHPTSGQLMVYEGRQRLKLFP